MTLNVDVTLIESIDELYELKRWMSLDHPYLAVDTETEGLSWWKHKPRVLQIGDANKAWVIPFDGWGAAILEILRDYKGKLIMHNARFDTHVFEHETGVKLPHHKIHDTMVMANVLDSTRSPALKPLCEQYVDRTAAQSQRILSSAFDAHGWDWDTVPIDFPPYWLYAGMDCILTSRLYDIFYPQVMAEAPRAYELEMGTSWVLMQMESNGIEIDLDYAREKRDLYEIHVDSVEAWCIEHYGVKPGAKQDVIDKVQADTNYSFVYKNEEGDVCGLTDKGERSLDKDALIRAIYHTQHPLLIAVKDRRKVQHMLTTYLRKFVKLEHNGRIYPSFNGFSEQRKFGQTDNSAYGAVTSRMTMRDPSFHNLPRKDNSNPVVDAIRNCVTATGRGETHKLILSDLDQVEFRMGGSFANDPSIKQAFIDADAGVGPDFFTKLARDIYGDESLIKDDNRRTTTKNSLYAKSYGAGNEKIATTAGVPVATIDAFMDRYDDLYPGMGQFSQMVIGVARQRLLSEDRAYVRSPLTQRKFYSNEPEKLYVLVNYLIQGTCAELLKMKDVEMMKHGVGQYMILNVHDEVVLDVPNDEVADAKIAVYDIMNDQEMFNGLFNIPLTAGIGAVDRWGSNVK